MTDSQPLIDYDRFDIDEYLDPDEYAEVHPTSAWVTLIEEGNLELDSDDPDMWVMERLTALFVEANERHDMDAQSYSSLLTAVSHHFNTIISAEIEAYIDETGQRDRWEELLDEYGRRVEKEALD